MVTYTAVTKENIEKTIDWFVKSINEMIEKNERELIIATDFGGGTVSAPSKRKNHYKLLPPILAPDTFKNGMDISPLIHAVGFTVLLVPKGSILEKKSE